MDDERTLMDIEGRSVWSLLKATEILKERTGTNYSISGRNGAVMTPLHAATNWRKSKGSDVPDIAPKLNSFKAGGVKFVYVDDFEEWFSTFEQRPGGQGIKHEMSHAGQEQEEHGNSETE